MKEEVPEDKVFRIKWFTILTGTAIVVYLIWLFFFSYTSCNDWTCFNKNLKSCSKANFIGGSKMIFEYSIIGKSNNLCNVNVKLLQGDLGSEESKKLEGHEMICSLTPKVVMLPESDLNSCHGILKENLQDLIIQKLHSYIAQNLGRINLNILETPEIKEKNNLTT